MCVYKVCLFAAVSSAKFVVVLLRVTRLWVPSLPVRLLEKPPPCILHPLYHRRLGESGVGWGSIPELSQGAGQHVDHKLSVLGEKVEGQSTSTEISLEEGTQTSRGSLDQGWAGNSYCK